MYIWLRSTISWPFCLIKSATNDSSGTPLFRRVRKRLVKGQDNLKPRNHIKAHKKNVKIMPGFRGSGQVIRPNPWSKNLCLPVTIWTLEVLCLCRISVIHGVHPVVLGVFHSALSPLHFSFFYLPLQFICPTLTLFSSQFSVAPTGMAMEGRCKFQPPARVKISVRGTNITMHHTEKYENDTVYLDVHKYQTKHFMIISKAIHSHDGKGVLRPNKLEFGRSLFFGLSSIFTWAWKRTCSTTIPWWSSGATVRC